MPISSGSQNPNQFSLFGQGASFGFPLPQTYGTTTFPGSNPFQQATFGASGVDQLGAFQNALGSSLNPNLGRPPLLPEGMGLHFQAVG